MNEKFTKVFERYPPPKPLSEKAIKVSAITSIDFGDLENAKIYLKTLGYDQQTANEIVTELNGIVTELKGGDGYLPLNVFYASPPLSDEFLETVFPLIE
jgi:hypothetical protein